MLNVVKLSVIMLSIVMLSVVAPNSLLINKISRKVVKWYHLKPFKFNVVTFSVIRIPQFRSDSKKN
jgi:hypothetical protein